MNYPTVPNVFTSGSTAIAANFNANYSALASGLTDGTKDININSLCVASTFNVVGDMDSLIYIGATITFPGWSSVANKNVYYKKIGKIYLIYFYVSGTSSGVSPGFSSLPFTINYGYGPFSYGFLLAKDNNGGPNNYIGQIIVNGSNSLQIFPNYSSNSYITPNGKTLSVQGQCVVSTS